MSLYPLKTNSSWNDSKNVCFPSESHPFLQQMPLKSLLHYGTVSGHCLWLEEWRERRLLSAYYVSGIRFASAILFEVIKRCLSICFYSTKFFKLLQVIIRHRSNVDTFFAFKRFRPSEGTLRKQMRAADWPGGSLSTRLTPRSGSSLQLQGAVGSSRED